MFRWSGKAVIGATTTERILTPKESVQVQRAWAVRNDDFGLLLQRYQGDVSKLKRKPTLREWEMKSYMANRWPASELPLVHKMKLMSRRCKVNHFLLLSIA